MENNEQNKVVQSRNQGWTFGLVLILVGAAFAAINFGWASNKLGTIILSWPMVFVLVALISFFKREYWSVPFWLLLATFFLLPRIARVYPLLLPWVGGDFIFTYWPILLILIGVGIVVKFIFHRQSTYPAFHSAQNGYVSAEGRGGNGFYEKEAVFGSSSDIFLEPEFRGGRIKTVFGGVELDLRRTELPEGDTYLYVESVFGGITLYLPQDWIVVSQVNTVLSGVENKRFVVGNTQNASRRLIIRGEIVFSGCVIR